MSRRWIADTVWLCHGVWMADVAMQPIKSDLVEPNSGDKPLIVCIHGGGCNAQYFDLPGFSFRERAIDRNYPLLLVNRPGHGGSDERSGGDFPAMAAAIMAHVDEVTRARGFAGWFLLGHSIGAAVATIIAGDLRPDGLHALAVTGIGDRPTHLAHTWASNWTGTPADLEIASDMLFGARESYSWRALKALRHAAEPWRQMEIKESLGVWPNRIANIAAGVTVPVHIRLADAERIWETGPAALIRLASLFHRASHVDAALLPEGGHLYEVHHRGSELMEAQLDFFDAVTQRLDSSRSDGIPLHHEQHA